MSEFFVHESSYIDDNVAIGEGTKIWFFCHIQKGAIIRDSVIMPGARIDEYSIIEKAIVGPGCKIGKNVMIGVRETEDNPYKSDICTDEIVLIEGNVIIDDGTEIGKNSMVENDIICENVLFEKKAQHHKSNNSGIAKGGA